MSHLITFKIRKSIDNQQNKDYIDNLYSKNIPSINNGIYFKLIFTIIFEKNESFQRTCVGTAHYK